MKLVMKVTPKDVETCALCEEDWALIITEGAPEKEVLKGEFIVIHDHSDGDFQQADYQVCKPHADTLGDDYLESEGGTLIPLEITEEEEVE